MTPISVGQTITAAQTHTGSRRSKKRGQANDKIEQNTERSGTDRGSRYQQNSRKIDQGQVELPGAKWNGDNKGIGGVKSNMAGEERGLLNLKH